MRRIPCWTSGGLPALLLLVGAAGAQQQTALGPLTIDDLESLVATGVSPSQLSDALGERGIGFPLTPAIRRHLKSSGIPLSDKELRQPSTSDVERPLAGSGLAWTPPSGWVVRETAEATSASDSPVQGASGLRIAVSRRTLDDRTLRGETAGIRTLQDLLLRTAQPIASAHKLACGEPVPIAARGTTGVMVSCDGEPEPDGPARIVVAAFTRRRAAVFVRADIYAPRGDLRIESWTRELHDLLHGVLPEMGSPAAARPANDRRFCFVTIAREPSRRVLVLDRSGREVPPEAWNKGTVLGGDPTCLRVAIKDDEPITPFGNKDHAFVLEEASREPSIPSSPLMRDPLSAVAHKPNFLFAASHPHLRRRETTTILAPWEGTIEAPERGDAALDIEGRSIGGPIANGGAIDLMRWPLDGKTPAGLIRSFKPAHRVDVACDPGSELWLVAVASVHHPLPLPGAGPPMTAVRFLYVRDAQTEPIPLFYRAREGDEAAMPHSPRFTPSAFEVMYIDPELGLCVLPRDGGLPVQIRDDVIAAEPWIDLRPK